MRAATRSASMTRLDYARGVIALSRSATTQSMLKAQASYKSMNQQYITHTWMWQESLRLGQDICCGQVSRTRMGLPQRKRRSFSRAICETLCRPLSTGLTIPH